MERQRVEIGKAGATFRLQDVTVSYPGERALETVSLEIRAGEAVGLVGPSGSGKTTLLRLLIGGLRPASGSVSVDGRVLKELSPRDLRAVRAHIGFIHQDLRLVPNLSVAQNVLSGRLGVLSLPASLRSLLVPSRGDLAEVHQVLEKVGIAEKLFQRLDRLSGGQKQRVAIARALFQRPGAILADEPVSSVDPARARATVRLLREICEEEGLTLVMSLHNLDLARESFPRLIGLRRGRVVFDRAGAAIADREYQDLYRLTDEEMLRDGIGD